MPAPAFRIFVSSTFADLGREREALRRTVFPRLRALSRRHGAQFLAVDLRWGVSPEAAVDQRTVAICLEEVDRCLQTGSPMIVLLGDRYGWRPLPDPLPAGVFEALRERIALPASEELAYWYRRDENAEPPEYRLQPRGPMRIDDDEWSAVEARLRDELVIGVGAAGVSPCERRRIGASATELEILRGALQREDVFCYFREIEDLPLDEGWLCASTGDDATVRIWAIPELSERDDAAPGRRPVRRVPSAAAGRRVRGDSFLIALELMPPTRSRRVAELP